jgi:hypothetical protein
MNPKAWLVTLVVLMGLTGCQGVGGVNDNTPRLSKVESDPPGASVFVGGGFVATTPASFYLPAKERVGLRLELPGYLPVDEVIVRSKSVPKDAQEGVGWDEVYFYELYSK